MPARAQVLAGALGLLRRLQALGGGGGSWGTRAEGLPVLVRVGDNGVRFHVWDQEGSEK